MQRNGEPSIRHPDAGWSGRDRDEAPPHNLTGFGREGGRDDEAELRAQAQAGDDPAGPETPDTDVPAPEVEGAIPGGTQWAPHHAGSAGPGRTGGDGPAVDTDFMRWREAQLEAHDRAYTVWRRAQATRLDTDYDIWRREHDQGFGEAFVEWQRRRAAAEGGSPPPHKGGGG